MAQISPEITRLCFTESIKMEIAKAKAIAFQNKADDMTYAAGASLIMRMVVPFPEID